VSEARDAQPVAAETLVAPHPCGAPARGLLAPAILAPLVVPTLLGDWLRIPRLAHRYEI